MVLLVPLPLLLPLLVPLLVPVPLLLPLLVVLLLLPLVPQSQAARGTHLQGAWLRTEIWNTQKNCYWHA